MGVFQSFKDIDTDVREKEIERFQNEEKYGEIDQLFLKFDENSNGFLSEEEIKVLLKHYLSIHPEYFEKINEICDQIEIDDNRPMTQQDFRRLMDFYFNNPSEEEKIIEVFKIFDKNNEFEMTILQIIHVFNRLGLNLSSSEVNSMLLEADDSGDGSLDFEEFILVMIAK